MLGLLLVTFISRKQPHQKPLNAAPIGFYDEQKSQEASDQQLEDITPRPRVKISGKNTRREEQRKDTPGKPSHTHINTPNKAYHLNSSGKETRFFRKTWFLAFQTPGY
jgi:hypothetical protein